MSLVTKCDICGEIYKSSIKPQSSSFRFDGHNFIDLEKSRTDLCPECTKQVLNFMDVLKTGNRYVIHQFNGSEENTEE